MVRNTRLSTTRAEIGGLATGVSLGSLPPPKGGPSTETVLKALHERIAALEGQLELLRQVIAVDSGGNLTVAVPGHITLSAGGALHDFSVTVTSSAAGYHQAKQAAAAVSDALLNAPLPLSRGRVGRVQFHRAQAARSGADRRIEIWFRARLDEDAG